MSFVPKVKVFEFVLLSVHPIPSGMLGFLSLGPANELGSIFEGEGLTRRSNPPQMVAEHAGEVHKLTEIKTEVYAASFIPSCFGSS